MLQKLKIAVGEMTGVLHDIPVNFACAAKLAEAAAAAGARLIILPEACLTGYAMNDVADQAALPLEASVFTPLTDVAVAGNITVCAGFVTEHADGVNCCQTIIEPDGSVRFQRKAARAASEPHFFRAFESVERVIFTVDGVRIAIVICCEWGGKEVMNATVRAQAELALHPSAGSIPQAEVLFSDPGPAKLAEISHGMRKVVEKAAVNIREYRIPKVGANPLGFDGRTYWPGNSYAINADGSIAMWLEGTHLVSRMQPRFAIAEFSFTKPGH